MEFQASIFYLQLITFTLGLLLAYFIYMPYLRGWMLERRNRIAGQLEQAEKSLKAAEALKAEVDQKSREMDDKARAALADARTEADRARHEMVTAARAEADKILKDARASMEQEKQAALKSIQNEVGGLAVAIAEKILRSSVDAKSQQKLIDESLKELSAKKN